VLIRVSVELTRPVIDQAIDIMRSRTGITAEAVRRARARHSGKFET
jgi:hypothetical protein